MQEAAATFQVENGNNFIGEKSNLEHCNFTWIIKDFLDESGKNPELKFKASSKDEYFTLWQLDLSSTDPERDIRINLTRLKSPNEDLVFVRFRWEIRDTNGDKVFPGSIHALAYPSHRLSKEFVEIGKLKEDSPRFLPDGNLSVYCELTAYERTLEERISAQIKGNIPHALNDITDDLEKLFLTELGADMSVSSMDSTMRCHKSILTVRSSVFAESIAAERSPDGRLHLGDLTGDLLLFILTHMYLGCLDVYLQHTIPRDLYRVATEYRLEHLKQHLDIVNSIGLTMLTSLDVTWKLPCFKRLILQPKVTLYCPEQNTSTLYDKRWCFKLEFDSSSDGVDISVVRRHEENSEHHVEFVVQIEQCGQILFKETKSLQFEADGAKGIEAFMTKDGLSDLLSFDDTLVLRCSLEVIYYKRGSSGPQESRLKTLVEQMSDHADASLKSMTTDLRRMYAREIFSDEVVNTRMGRTYYHSFLARARFDLDDYEFKEFVARLDRRILKDFFFFLYGGDSTKDAATRIQQAAELRGVTKVVQKMGDFLLFYTG